MSLVVARSATTVGSASAQIVVNVNETIVATESAIVVALADAMLAVIGHAVTGPESTIAGMRETEPTGIAGIREIPGSAVAGSRILIATSLAVLATTTKMRTVMVSEIARRGSGVGVETDTESAMEMAIETGTGTHEDAHAVGRGVEIAEAEDAARRVLVNAYFGFCITTRCTFLIPEGDSKFPTLYDWTECCL